MTGVYCCMCLVLVLVFRRAALPTSKTRARATMAIVNISHRSQFLEYSHEENCVSLLMILSTVILIPPNLRLIANPFAFNSHKQSFNTINNARQIKSPIKEILFVLTEKQYDTIEKIADPSLHSG